MPLTRASPSGIVSGLTPSWLPNRLLLDASPPRRFSQAGCGALYMLVSFLGGRACVCSEVMRELWDGSNAKDAAELRHVLNKTPWPTDIGGVPPELLPEATRILAELSKPGDPGGKNVGEVATVLVAQAQGVPLIVMDDRQGQNLARGRGVVTLSTAHLCVRMAASGALGYDEALQVFLLSAPATRADFDAALQRELRTVGRPPAA